jgi:hypothetical protein
MDKEQRILRWPATDAPVQGRRKTDPRKNPRFCQMPVAMDCHLYSRTGTFSPGDLQQDRLQLVVASTASLAALVAATLLSVYKPRGRVA